LHARFERKAGGRLEALLLEGIESETSEFTRPDCEEIRKEALAQLKRRQSRSKNGGRR
jgi:hypothetical protein